MKVRVSKVSIPVRDQDRALKFYTEVLGFQLVRDTPYGEGARWLEVRAQAQDVHVVLTAPMSGAAQPGMFQSVLFTSDDVVATYEALKSKGVEFPMAPRKEFWGTSAVFKDLDGNTFSLASENR